MHVQKQLLIQLTLSRGKLLGPALRQKSYLIAGRISDTGTSEVQQKSHLCTECLQAVRSAGILLAQWARSPAHFETRTHLTDSPNSKCNTVVNTASAKIGSRLDHYIPVPRKEPGESQARSSCWNPPWWASCWICPRTFCNVTKGLAHK